VPAPPLVVRRWFDADPRALAAASRAALACPFLVDGGDAELWLARPASDAVAVGAFQRATGIDSSTVVVRRGSGGPLVRLGAGSLWIGLLLARVDALVACDEARILNRHVRPILRALTKTGHLAHYFGRDWISVRHRPAAWVGFAHDAASGRVVVEAVVACRTRFDVGERASFLGKEPVTLDADPAAVAAAVALAWAAASSRDLADGGSIPRFEVDPNDDPRADPPWAAEVEEAIGPVAAGPDARGRFRVGGDLLVSRDAVLALEATLPSTPDADVGALVDATLGAPGVALDGVRALTSVRDAILAARAKT
jgi:hypothetical protein